MRGQRLRADDAHVTYLEEEVAVSIAKRVGLTPEIARICLLGGICQACPQSVRPRMTVIEATLTHAVDKFKVDAVAARMIVGAAARNRYCLRGFVTHTACQNRSPESDKSDSDTKATVAVLDAIAAEEVEMLHATSGVTVDDKDLEIFDSELHARRKQRIVKMNALFDPEHVRKLSNLEVFAFDLAEETQGNEAVHKIEKSVDLAKKIVDLVGIMLNDRGVQPKHECGEVDSKCWSKRQATCQDQDLAHRTH